MYKDKSKEREAARLRKQRQRAKGVTLGRDTGQGVTYLDEASAEYVLSKGVAGCGYPAHGTVYYGPVFHDTPRCPDCGTVLVRRSDAQHIHNEYMSWRYS